MISVGRGEGSRLALILYVLIGDQGLVMNKEAGRWEWIELVLEFLWN
jgi:hypothetical protein